MNQGGMPEQPPAGEEFRDKYENGKDVNKINIGYCVTSGAGSRNIWF